MTVCQQDSCCDSEGTKAWVRSLCPGRGMRPAHMSGWLLRLWWVCVASGEDWSWEGTALGLWVLHQ